MIWKLVTLYSVVEKEVMQLCRNECEKSAINVHFQLQTSGQAHADESEAFVQ